MHLNNGTISCSAVEETVANNDLRYGILEYLNDGKNQEFSASKVVEGQFIQMHSA